MLRHTCFAIPKNCVKNEQNICKLRKVIFENRLPRYYSSSGKRPTIDLSSIIKPIIVEASKNPDDINIGVELTQNYIKKEEMIRILNTFYRLPQVKTLAEEQGLDQRLFSQAFLSFRKFCIESDALPVDLHIVMSDILVNAGHASDIFPYFLTHAKKMFPHIDCMDDLKKISDLTDPLNWYAEARAHSRKIIFHSGPTNSGKTYQALQRFINARSGIYCGPLKMLANEVFHKCNQQGTPCDLITGEERKIVDSEGKASNHIACTVEMTKLFPDLSDDNNLDYSNNVVESKMINSDLDLQNQQSNNEMINPPPIKKHAYEVAIIDEIQMIKDPVRGWAWTRALLGLVADEIHLCGEAGAINLVKDLLAPIGENVEVRRYKRLTPLRILDKPLASFDNVREGDCIVCFSKNDIYMISQKIEARGIPCAVIYGSLPPGTKLEQAKRFNDPTDPCKIMVATDAIGMGINLNIKRIIFYSLLKPSLNENTGEREMERLSISLALQIAGRAGRFGFCAQNNQMTPSIENNDVTINESDETLILEKNISSDQIITTAAQQQTFINNFDSDGAYETGGEVTCFSMEDLYTLKSMLKNGKAQTEPIESAGLHPTAEQIELFSYHLPRADLSNLIDIFTALSKLDNARYFMCNMEDFKFLADVCRHIPLPLRVRYVFCCAPISRKQMFACAMFLKFARQYSRGQPLTFEWLCTQLNDWPFSPPNTISDLIHLEGVFDVLDMYLWLSYRFPDMFPDISMVRDMQTELDAIIRIGVSNLTKLLCNSSAAGPGLVNEENIDNLNQSTIKHVNLYENYNDDGKITKKRSPTKQHIAYKYNNSQDCETIVKQQRRPFKKDLNQNYNDENAAINKKDEEQNSNFSHGGFRLIERLLERGLLTPKMISDLQKEWMSQKRTGSFPHKSKNHDAQKNYLDSSRKGFRKNPLNSSSKQSLSIDPTRHSSDK